MIPRHLSVLAASLLLFVLTITDTTKITAANTVMNDSKTRKIYVDSTFGFQINYPHDFVVRPQNVVRLAEFTPIPAASIFFMNPTMAAGDLAGIEPPDLEVRVYQVGVVNSLTSWLLSVGFTSADNSTVIQTYRNSGVTGLKVCQSTMLAPGCSVYVLHRDHVYQLTAISVEGETMINTFQFVEK